MLLPKSKHTNMKYTKEILEPVIQTSFSISEVMRRLGIRVNGGGHSYMSNVVRGYGLDTSHFKTKRVGITAKKHWSEYLVSGRVVKTEQLRRALIEYGRSYVCEKCGCPPEWNGAPLVLQIDHKDGETSNNIPINLEFLCPNCHTQTPTYGQPKEYKHTCHDCGRRMRRGGSRRCQECFNKSRPTKRLSREELSELVWKMPIRDIARQSGVSDFAVRSWCKFYDIDRPGPKYWSGRFLAKYNKDS